MVTRARVGLAAVLLAACAACGGADVVAQGGPPPTPEPVPTEAPPPADGELVTSQPVLPAEPALSFADIATTTEDAARAWQRFGLTGEPPVVAEGREALLFRGLGESGSCPVELAGLAVEGDRVELAPAPGGAATRACTADYRARTLVVAVPLAALPAGAFTFADHPLSTTVTDAPPPGPATFGTWTSADPELALRGEPAAVAAGRPVEVLVTTGALSALPGFWEVLLERWEGQRWLPAPGAARSGDHPAATPARETVPARSTGPVATVDTTGLPPGAYRLLARVSLGGGGEDGVGSTAVQGPFTVTG